MMSRDPKGSERRSHGTTGAKKVSAQPSRVPQGVIALRETIEIESSDSDIIVLDSLSSSDDDLPSCSYLTPSKRTAAGAAANVRRSSHEYRRSPLSSRTEAQKPRLVAKPSHTPGSTSNSVDRPRTHMPTKSKPNSGSSVESARVSGTKRSPHSSDPGASKKVRQSPSPPTKRRSLHERPRHRSESNSAGRSSRSQRSAHHALSSKTAERSPLALHSTSSPRSGFGKHPAKERSGSKSSSSAKSSGRNETSSSSRVTSKRSGVSDRSHRQGRGGSLSVFSRLGHNFSDSDSSDSLSRFDLPDEPGLVPSKSGAIRGLADEPGLVPSKSGAIRFPVDEPGLIPSKSGALRSPADSTSSSDFPDEPGRVASRGDDVTGGFVSRPDSPEKRGPIPSRSGAVRSSNHDRPDEPASKSGAVRRLFTNDDNRKKTAPSSRTRHPSRSLPKSPVALVVPDVAEATGSQTVGTRKRHTSAINLTAEESRQLDRDVSASEIHIVFSGGPSEVGESDKSHSTKAKGSRTDKVTTETGSKSSQSKAAKGSTSHSSRAKGSRTESGSKSHQSMAGEGVSSHSSKVLGSGKSHSSKATESSKSDSSKCTASSKSDLSKVTASSKSDSSKVTESSKSDSSKTTESSKSDSSKATASSKSDSSKATESSESDSSKATESSKSDSSKSTYTGSKSHSRNIPKADSSHSSRATEKSLSSKAQENRASGADKSHSRNPEKSHSSETADKSHASHSSKVAESHSSKTQSKSTSESNSTVNFHKVSATVKPRSSKPGGSGIGNKKTSTSKGSQKPPPLGALSGTGTGSTESQPQSQSQSQVKGRSEHNTSVTQNTPRTVEPTPKSVPSKTSSTGKGHSDLNQTNSPALPITPSLPVASKSRPKSLPGAGRPQHKEPQLTTPPTQLPGPAQLTSPSCIIITGLISLGSAVTQAGGLEAGLQHSRGSTTASSTLSSKGSGLKSSNSAKTGDVHTPGVLTSDVHTPGVLTSAETNLLQQSSSRKTGVKPLKTSRKIKLKCSDPVSQDVLTSVTKRKGKKSQAVSKDNMSDSSSTSGADPFVKGGSAAKSQSVPLGSTSSETIAHDTDVSKSRVSVLSTAADLSSDTDALSIISGEGALVIPVRPATKAGQQTNLPEPNPKHVRRQTARKSTGGIIFKRSRICFSSGRLPGYGRLPLKKCSVDVVRTKVSRKRTADGDADRSGGGPSISQGEVKRRKYSKQQTLWGGGSHNANVGQISSVQLKSLTAINPIAYAVITSVNTIPDGIITPKKRKQRKEAKTLSMVIQSSDSESDAEPTPAVKKPRLVPPETEPQDVISAPEFSADELSSETCARTRVNRLPSTRKRIQSEPSFASVKTSSVPDCRPSGSGLPAGGSGHPTHSLTPSLSRSPQSLGVAWDDGSRQTVEKPPQKPSLVVATSLTPEKPHSAAAEPETEETLQAAAWLELSGPEFSLPEDDHQATEPPPKPSLVLATSLTPEVTREKPHSATVEPGAGKTLQAAAGLHLLELSGPEFSLPEDDHQATEPPPKPSLILATSLTPEVTREKPHSATVEPGAGKTLQAAAGLHLLELSRPEFSLPEDDHQATEPPPKPSLVLATSLTPDVTREKPHSATVEPGAGKTLQAAAGLHLLELNRPEFSLPENEHQASNVTLPKYAPSKNKLSLRLKPRKDLDRSVSEPPQSATPGQAPPPEKSSSVPPRLPPQPQLGASPTSLVLSKRSPRDEVYSLMLQETIAKLAGGGGEEDCYLNGLQRQSSTTATSPSHLTVSFQLASLNQQPSSPTPTNEPRSRLPSVTTTRLGTYVSQGVQAELGMIVNREVMESYLTVKTNEALYELKEMLEATDRQVARITREKEELEKLLLEKQKVIQKLTQTSFKHVPKRLNKATSTYKTTKSASTQTKRLRMPTVKRPPQKSRKMRPPSWRSLAAESTNCLHHYSEEELQSLFTLPASDPLPPHSPPGSGEVESVPSGDASEWLSREDSTSRCVPIRPQVRLIRAVRGGKRLRRKSEPPIGNRRNGFAVAEWDSLGVNLRGEFLQLWQVLNLFKGLPMEPLLLQRLARVIETLDHLLSHIPPPHDRDLALVGGDTQQISTVGFAAWLLGSKLQQLVINLEKLHGDEENCLPTYFRAELVQTRTVVIETLKFITDGMRHATVFHDTNGFAVTTSTLVASPSPDLSPSPGPSSLLQCTEDDLDDLDFTSGSDLESSSSEEEGEEEEEEGSCARTSVLYKKVPRSPSSCARVDSPWRAKGPTYTPATTSKMVSSIGSPGVSMSIATAEPGLLHCSRALQALKASVSTSSTTLQGSLEKAVSSASTNPDPSQNMDRASKVALLERVAQSITEKINQITAKHLPVPNRLSEMHDMFPPSRRISLGATAAVTIARSTSSGDASASSISTVTASASANSVSTATANGTKNSPITAPTSVVHMNAHDLLALTAMESTTAAATPPSTAMQTTACISGTVCTSRLSPQQFTRITDVLSHQQSNSVPKSIPAVSVTPLASHPQPLPAKPPTSGLPLTVLPASFVRPVNKSDHALPLNVKMNLLATRLKSLTPSTPPNSVNLATSALPRDLSRQVLNSLSRSPSQVLPPNPNREQLRQFLELARLPEFSSVGLRIPQPEALPLGPTTAAATVGAVQIPCHNAGMDAGHCETELGTITAQAPTVAAAMMGPPSRPLGPPATLQSSSSLLTSCHLTPENVSITGVATATTARPHTGPTPSTGTSTPNAQPLPSTKDSGPKPNSKGGLFSLGLPTPRLQVVSNSQGIMIKWTFGEEHLHKQRYVDSYDLYAHTKYKLLPLPPISQWGKVGSVTPLPLPMAVTLTNFARGQCYIFTVRASFKGGSKSAYSEPKSVTI